MLADFSWLSLFCLPSRCIGLQFSFFFPLFQGL
ncbi:hypothetical protein Patl1_10510 [Pistacia atlantica]|uniref:Uncharacterized protein n=1 Tax=Pistacia atlantica TaxID=434234 RepID=A0ACC1A4M5_9ROSI|nr:hypothetical protein Patl1_10510 [Pistacia atlantica]